MEKKQGRKGLTSKLTGAALRGAAASADQHAAGFCRYWIGQERVPKKLLEKECQR